MNECGTPRRTDPALRRTRTTRLDSGDPDAKREEIRQYFHATCDIDEALLETIRYQETFYKRADALRHPLIFYFGHTAVFYINKFLIARLIAQRLDPRFESMFAVGVDEMSWDDLNMGHYDWPTVDEVQAYRDRVRECVDEVIRTAPLALPITWDHPFWAVMMGIEHARIHLETSSVLLRQLPLEDLRAHPLWTICRTAGEPPANDFIDVASGKVRLGKDKSHPLYGWDNEYGMHEADVAAFKAQRFPVTNREFIEFVEDGCYRQAQWWTEEGWGWRTYLGAQCPRFWRNDGARYRLRTVLEEIEMPWDWPAEVNQLEAKAYCNWMAARTGKPVRLPTEDEWYLLRDRHVHADQPDWQTAPGNINLEHYASACPVTHFRFGEFGDVIGNVWQWTATPITGFRGFESHPYYDDFSTPTFDGKHNLIKGGSWISTGNEATRDSRYAFRRHFYQHAGFRCIESDAKVSVAVDVYETDATVCLYSEFQYGDEHFGVSNYAQACVEFALEHMRGRTCGRALDIGCATGRAAFELAREFDAVTGLDFSANLIRMGVTMQKNGAIRYTRVDEGELEVFLERRAAELGITGEMLRRVEFFQVDACNLKPLYTGYDLVLATNLIDRLYNPRKFLSTIHERINPGGLLVLTSPYTWLAEFTKREEWIGGFRRDGEPFTTLEGLEEILASNFRRLDEPRDIPFVIRETRRKFQHSIAQATVWAKR
jgi:5-histidylcysteine sulfoxide synthase/putative 4-mercaptohistidine N1-methyltranferase